MFWGKSTKLKKVYTSVHKKNRERIHFLSITEVHLAYVNQWNTEVYKKGISYMGHL